MTPVDAFINPDNIKNYVKSTKATPKLKFGDYVRNADKRNIFSEGYTFSWNNCTSKNWNNKKEIQYDKPI